MNEEEEEEEEKEGKEERDRPKIILLNMCYKRTFFCL